MAISTTLKTDKAWKFVQGLGITSTGKEFYEEDARDGGFTLHGMDIYVDDIPSTPPLSSTIVVEVVTDLILTNDTSVPNNLSWYASANGTTIDLMRQTRKKDWIPPRFGQGYTVVLKDNTGKQIFTTDSINWVFDYKTGILICESNPSTSYQLPLKISAYCYVGKRVVQASGNASWIKILDSANKFPVDNVEEALQYLASNSGTVGSDFLTHLSNPTGAHAATAISIIDSGNYFTGVNVESALGELAVAISSLSSSASGTTVADSGNYYTSNNVEGALQEIGQSFASNVITLNNHAFLITANSTATTTVSSNLDLHISDTLDAHDASAISLLDANGNYASTDVENALSEIVALIDIPVSQVLAHIYTGDIAHKASTISFIPTVGLASINIQAAIEEVSAGSLKFSDLSASNGAALIGIADAGNYLDATNIEGALQEIAADVSHDSIELTNIGSDLQNHLSSVSGAHSAEAIAIVDTGDKFVATNVEEALSELALSLYGISLEADKVSILDVAGNFTATDIEGALIEIASSLSTDSANIVSLNNGLQEHINDASGAHAANAISIVDSASFYTSPTVEGALAEVATLANADSVAISGHIANSDGAHVAGAISLIDSNDHFESTNLEGALNEIGNDIHDQSIQIANLSTASQNHITAITNAHLATTIAVTDSENKFVATNVEGVLSEIGASVSENSIGLQSHVNNVINPHNASSIPVDDLGNKIIATQVEGALSEIVGKVDADSEIIANHIDQSVDAHDASAISLLDAGDKIIATAVEGAFQEIYSRVEINENTTNDHISDTVGAHAASTISILDVNENYNASDVEGVLADIANNLQDTYAELVSHEMSLTSHLAKNIVVEDNDGLLSSVNVESALAELKTAMSGISSEQHAQNTDIGTSSSTFKIDRNNANAIVLKNENGDLRLRNGMDNDDVNLIVNNLTVNGTQVIVNSEIVNIADNIITLNSDVTGTPTQNAGIEVRRGVQVNSSVIWDEVGRYWKSGLLASEKRILLLGDESLIDHNLLENTHQNVSTLDTPEFAQVILNSANVQTVAIFNDDKAVVSSSVTVAELTYLSGLSGNVQSQITGHISNTTGAHAASAISFSDSNFQAIEVDGALVELLDMSDNINSRLTGHISNATGAHAASAISVQDNNNAFTSSTVEGVLSELNVGLQAHINEMVSAHIATSIAILDVTGVFTSTEVEGALKELDDEAKLAIAKIEMHEASTTAHFAETIQVLDSSNYYGSINVEGVLTEIGDSLEVNNLLILSHFDDDFKAHAASAISLLDTGNRFTSTEIESVVSEIGGEIDALSASLSSNLSAHITDTVDAHDASAISLLDTGNRFTSTEIESVVSEIGGELDALSASLSSNLSAHIIDTVDAHDASAISLLDTGNRFTAIEIESAISEIGGEIDGLNSDLSLHKTVMVDAHDASAISVLDAANKFTSNDVEGALNELATSIGNISLQAIYVSVLDTANHFTATDVEGALAELATSLGNISLQAIYVSVLDTANNYAETSVEGVLAEIATNNNLKAGKVGTSDIEITDFNKGVILRSPNGSRWRITVDNNGVLSTAAL